MEPRARRALAAVGLAVVLVAVVGATYLKPWQAWTLARAPAAAVRAAPPRSAPSVQQLHFLSATAGWVVTGGAFSSTLFRTLDGGRHWQRQLAGVAGDGWTLRFFDATHGVLYAADQRGPALWRTGDGGQHWTRVTVPAPTQPRLVYFADPNHGWCLAAVGAQPFGTLIADRQEVALFRTIDGGASWSQVLRTDRRSAEGGLDGDGVKTWIWFRDPNAGWIGQTTLGGHAVVYTTVDGGDRWIRWELPPPAAGWGSPAGVSDDDAPTPLGTGSLAMVVAPIVEGPNPGSLLLQNWYAYTWLTRSWADPVQLPGPAFSVVGHTQGRRWWAASGSTLLESDDAGNHWRAVGNGPAGRLFFRFDAVDPDHAWALLLDPQSCRFSSPCVFSLGRTADGGRHWTLVSAPA